MELPTIDDTGEGPTLCLLAAMKWVLKGKPVPAWGLISTTTMTIHYLPETVLGAKHVIKSYLYHYFTDKTKLGDFQPLENLFPSIMLFPLISGTPLLSLLHMFVSI